MKQISLFDLKPKELPLGYIRDDARQYIGKEIPYNELRNYIDQRIILELPRQSAVDYKVVMVKEYLTECDKVYRWHDGTAEQVGVCDRIAFTDDNKRFKTNSWISEMYCRNGRYEGGKYPCTMYEIQQPSEQKKMTEEEIDTMLAKALVGQTDCSWMRYEE